MQGLRPPRVGSTVQVCQFEPMTSAIRPSRESQHATDKGEVAEFASCRRDVSLPVADHRSEVR